ncbi:hypothetical protein K492DRAFT_173807 [Lichtheimia hyalospora FSU 10163]|nr:hypothetical protein K492DRAFT_173807 [Lichtheimia hyalospora FSU 10163]
MPLSQLFKPAPSHSQPATTIMHDGSNSSSRILSREFPPLPHTTTSPSELLDKVGHPQQLMDYTQPYVHEQMNDAILSPPQLLVIPKKASTTMSASTTGGDNGSFCERAQITDKENCEQTKEEPEYSSNTIAWIEHLVHIYRQREADWIRREAIYRTREAWLCQRLREAEQELKWWSTCYHNNKNQASSLAEDDDDGGDSNAHVSPDRALYDTLSENVSDEGSVTPSRHPSNSSHCYGWSTPSFADPSTTTTPSFHSPNHSYYYYGSPRQDRMLDYTSHAWHNTRWWYDSRNLPHHPATTRRRRINTARNLIL